MIKGQILYDSNSGEVMLITSEPRMQTPEEMYRSMCQDIEGQISRLFIEESEYDRGDWPPSSDPQDLTHKGRVELRKLDRQLRKIKDAGIEGVSLKKKNEVFWVERGYAG